MTRTRNQTRARLGISIVECVIATAVLGGAVGATLNVVGQSGRRAALDQRQAEATLLAQELMTEIRSKPLAGTSGREANGVGGGRSGFNEVEDYWYRTETPPVRTDGTRHPIGRTYTRSVNAYYISPRTLYNEGQTTDAAIVEVEVSQNGASLVVLRTVITAEVTP